MNFLGHLFCNRTCLCFQAHWLRNTIFRIENVLIKSRSAQLTPLIPIKGIYYHSHSLQHVIILTQAFTFVSWVKQAVLHA